MSEPLSYISPKAQVQPSPIHGRGLFAVAAFTTGEIAAVKGGHVFDRTRLRQIAPALGPAEIQIGEDLFIGPLTAEEREGSMIYSNHSCDPNLGVRGQVVFVARRNIEAGEELTHDWAMTDDDEERTDCCCGSPQCRKVITGQDWRRTELQARYAEYMSSYLLDKIRRGV